MVSIKELKASTLKIENTSDVDKTIFIYVPNKDNIPHVLHSKESINITTLSAGESYVYLSQATDTLTVEAVSDGE